MLPSPSGLFPIVPSFPLWPPSSRPPPCRQAAAGGVKGRELVLHGGAAGPGQISAEAKAALTGTVMVPTAAGGQKEYTPSAAISRRLASKWPRPAWHAPWRMYRVISGHLGWVGWPICHAAPHNPAPLLGSAAKWLLPQCAPPCAHARLPLQPPTAAAAGCGLWLLTPATSGL